MSANLRQHYKEMLKKVGHWAGVRYMKNQGVSLDEAYFIIFGKPNPHK